jgi:hypothetical protein
VPKCLACLPPSLLRGALRADYYPQAATINNEIEDIIAIPSAFTLQFQKFQYEATLTKLNIIRLI